MVLLRESITLYVNVEQKKVDEQPAVQQASGTDIIFFAIMDVVDVPIEMNDPNPIHTDEGDICRTLM